MRCPCLPRGLFPLLFLGATTLLGCGDAMTPAVSDVNATPGDVLEPRAPDEIPPVTPPAAEAAEPAATEPAAPPTSSDADTPSAAVEPVVMPADLTAFAAATESEAPPSDEAAAVDLVPMTFDAYLAQAATNPSARLTVVDAWATWCGPCKENFPHLVDMHKKYADKGLAAVSLSMDDPSDAAAVAEAKAFLTEQKATFTNVLLKEDFGVGFERFGINAIPAVFIYGPDGKEIRRFTGDDTRNQFTYEEVDQVVALLLEGKPLPDNAPGIAPPATP